MSPASSRPVLKQYQMFQQDSDLEVLEQYHLGFQEALEELLARHEKMLAQIAWKVASYHTRIAEREDFQGHGFVGATLAYRRFNMDLGAAKLSSFVHTTVEMHLRSMADLDGAIKIPTHKRVWRNYFSGRYDHRPEKKRDFEEKQGLIDPVTGQLDAEKIAAARDFYQLFFTDFVSLHEVQTVRRGSDGETVFKEFPDPCPRFEAGALVRLGVNQGLRQLTPFQELVFSKHFLEEVSVPEIALQCGVSVPEVRAAVRKVRSVMQQYLTLNK